MPSWIKKKGNIYFLCILSTTNFGVEKIGKISYTQIIILYASHYNQHWYHKCKILCFPYAR